ncbi:MAG TPA: endonuclease domain-containing protein [Devosia sp.]|jgi:very-short-patch-repair endonuclease|nr:endonuclease domain-containing protein [Devosia sp.]
MDDPVSFARKLRRDQTPAERRFWALLAPWRACGWHWRRQAPVGPYVVDFICKRIGLVIEIDGDSHYDVAGQAHDARRTAELAALGYRVLRFTNAEVLGNAAGVFDVMREVVGEPGRTPT